MVGQVFIYKETHMAKAVGTTTIITLEESDEASEHFELKLGWYTLAVTADSWGSAALQSSRIGSDVWVAEKNAAGNAIVFTANGHVLVPGNRAYRLASIDYTDDIEFSWARSV